MLIVLDILQRHSSADALQAARRIERWDQFVFLPDTGTIQMHQRRHSLFHLVIETIVFAYFFNIRTAEYHLRETYKVH